jgi:cGMP-dependent protein kinase
MPGQNIVEFGEQASSYYIIKEGTTECLSEKGVVFRELGPGESFGEQALYYNSTRGATVKAKTAVSVMVVAKDSLKEILGKNMQDVIYGNSDRWAIERSKLFSRLSKINQEKLLQSAIERRNVEEGEILVQRGKLVGKVIIVNEGELEYCVNIGEKYAKGSIFGEQFVYPNSNLEKLAEGDVIMRTKGVVAEMKADAMERILNGTLEEAISKYEKARVKKETKLVSKPPVNEMITKINLSNLVFLKKIGEGQFGSVFAVKDKVSGKLYALKAISISQVNDDGLEKHIICEKEVLTLIKGCHHLVDLQGYFRDKFYIYFLLEFIRGMELFDVIRVMDLLDNDQAKYYVASMILALEQLHNKSIVYRDLKPENVMIDEKGQLLLIDMGTAKVLNNSKKGLARTYTILGTPHYMAPEILKGKGYDFAVDIWSLGICMYEFMCGLVPFGEECDDPYEVYQLISSQSLSYPNYFKDKKNKLARNLIEQLLNRKP